MFGVCVFLNVFLTFLEIENLGAKKTIAMWRRMKRSCVAAVLLWRLKRALVQMERSADNTHLAFLAAQCVRLGLVPVDDTGGERDSLHLRPVCVGVINSDAVARVIDAFASTVRVRAHEHLGVVSLRLGRPVQWFSTFEACMLVVSVKCYTRTRGTPVCVTML